MKIASLLGILALIGSIAHAQIRVSGQPSAAAVVSAPAKFEPKGNTVYHGASVPEAWNENGLKRQIGDYNAAAGKRISVVTWFASAYEKGVMTNWRQNYASNLHRVKRLGAASLIKFSTQDYLFSSTKKQANMKQIAAGGWDAYFAEAARTLRDFESPVFLSINHEMNGNWYPYSQDYPGSGYTTSDYISAWKRIVDVFRRQGANNVAFVWSPNVPDVGNFGFASYYPGDDYVDWIGVSLYSGNDANAMDAIYKSYAAKKPFFITEWATAPEKNQYHPRFPGEVEWVKQFFAALETRYPRVKAISWFNWNQGDGDYRLQRVPGQAKAYAQDISNERYVDRANALVGANTGQDLVRVEKPGNEIILRETFVAPPPLVQPRRQRSLAERIKIEAVPIEQVRRGR